MSARTTVNPRTRRTGWFIVGGLLVALLLAGVVSNFASSDPDGLESALVEGCTVDEEGRIAGGTCPAQSGRDHELGDSPLADYGFLGIDNPFLSTAIAGVLGVLLTFAIGGGLFWLARRGRPPSRGESSPSEAASGAGSD